MVSLVVRDIIQAVVILMKRYIFRRGRAPARPAHAAILRDAWGRVPYIKQSFVSRVYYAV